MYCTPPDAGLLTDLSQHPPSSSALAALSWRHLPAPPSRPGALAASEKKRLEDEARAIETAAASERQRIADLEVARVTAANAERERLERDAIAAQASGDTAALAAIEQQVGTLIESGDLAASQAREQSTQIDAAATCRSANLQQLDQL